MSDPLEGTATNRASSHRDRSVTVARPNRNPFHNHSSSAGGGGGGGGGGVSETFSSHHVSSHHSTTIHAFGSFANTITLPETLASPKHEVDEMQELLAEKDAELQQAAEMGQELVNRIRTLNATIEMLQHDLDSHQNELLVVHERCAQEVRKNEAELKQLRHYEYGYLQKTEDIQTLTAQLKKLQANYSELEVKYSRQREHQYVRTIAMRHTIITLSGSIPKGDTLEVRYFRKWKNYTLQSAKGKLSDELNMSASRVRYLEEQEEELFAEIIAVQNIALSIATDHDISIIIMPPLEKTPMSLVENLMRVVNALRRGLKKIVPVIPPPPPQDVISPQWSAHFSSLFEAYIDSNEKLLNETKDALLTSARCEWVAHGLEEKIHDMESRERAMSAKVTQEKLRFEDYKRDMELKLSATETLLQTLQEETSTQQHLVGAQSIQLQAELDRMKQRVRTLETESSTHVEKVEGLTKSLRERSQQVMSLERDALTMKVKLEEVQLELDRKRSELNQLSHASNAELTSALAAKTMFEDQIEFLRSTIATKTKSYEADMKQMTLRLKEQEDIARNAKQQQTTLQCIADSAAQEAEILRVTLDQAELNLKTVKEDSERHLNTLVSTMRTEWEEKLRGVTEKLQLEMDALRAENDRYRVESAQLNRANFSGAETLHSTERRVQALQRDLQVERSRHFEEIQSLQASHETVVRALRHEVQQQMTALKIEGETRRRTEGAFHNNKTDATKLAEHNTMQSMRIQSLERQLDTLSSAQKAVSELSYPPNRDILGIPASLSGADAKVPNIRACEDHVNELERLQETWTERLRGRELAYERQYQLQRTHFITMREACTRVMDQSKSALSELRNEITSAKGFFPHLSPADVVMRLEVVLNRYASKVADVKLPNHEEFQRDFSSVTSHHGEGGASPSSLRSKLFVGPNSSSPHRNSNPKQYQHHTESCDDYGVRKSLF